MMDLTFEDHTVAYWLLEQRQAIFCKRWLFILEKAVQSANQRPSGGSVLDAKDSLGPATSAP